MDYKTIVDKYPWIIGKSCKAVISSDADGIVSGLLMSSLLNWEIVGYYDSETLLIYKNVSCQECVFLDVEIFRENIRSIGHHIILFDSNFAPLDFAQKTNECINPNLIRRIDKKTYTKKYPLGTAHLLLKLIENIVPEVKEIDEKGIPVLLFIDGVWNTYRKYQKNILDWINYLDMENSMWWKKLTGIPYIEMEKMLDKFINEINSIDNDSSFGHINLHDFKSNILFTLLDICSRNLRWEYNRDLWRVTNLKEYSFQRSFTYLNKQEDFEKFWAHNPFSLATYFGNKISYTVENPTYLP